MWNEKGIGVNKFMRLSAALLAMAAVLAVTATAQAASSEVSWRVPSGSAGKPLAFRWKASIPRGGYAEVQQPEGTRHVWRGFLKLKGTSGLADLPARGIGSYQFRIAVISRTGKLLADRSASAHYFGLVPLSTVFPAGVYTYQGANAAFPAVFGAWLGGGIPSIPVLSLKSQACTGISLNVEVGDIREQHWASEANDQFVTEIAPETTAPVTQAMSFNQPYTLSAAVPVGQTVELIVKPSASNFGYANYTSNGGIDGQNFTGEYPSDGEYLFINGVALCDVNNSTGMQVADGSTGYTVPTS